MKGNSHNAASGGALPDLLCLSHLRWSFVFQRPQHLMSRCARERRVFFFEEPVWGPGPTRLEVERSPEGVFVAVPHMEVPGATHVTPDPPPGFTPDWDDVARNLRELLDGMIAAHRMEDYIAWFYTPMALNFASHLEPRATVYDCMDELSAFLGAPPVLLEREAELIRRADVMFTGGHHLFEHKRERHANVHPFPSSVDVPHFAQARSPQEEPGDQLRIAHPRLGYIGVIDERMDLELLESVARARPDWQLVMIGPVVKISQDQLPKLPNIHWLGGKKYTELPRYLAGWDVAMLPFARIAATRFLSPTKTPEYLAAGVPVVSTSIRDVVRPYGELGLVRIADTAADFVRAVEESLAQERGPWLERVDALLAQNSWDRTWGGMKRHLDAAAGLSRKPELPLTSLTEQHLEA